MPIVTTVVTDYLQLRGLDEQLAIVQRTLGVYGESMRLFELKFKCGQVPQRTLHVDAPLRVEIAPQAAADASAPVAPAPATPAPVARTRAARPIAARCAFRGDPQREERMSVIGTIVIGFVVGIVFRFITPGDGRSGFFLAAALGIAGAIGATWVGQAFGIYREGQSAGFIGALIGAVILLVLYHLVVRRKTY